MTQKYGLKNEPKLREYFEPFRAQNGRMDQLVQLVHLEKKSHKIFPQNFRLIFDSNFWVDFFA